MVQTYPARLCTIQHFGGIRAAPGPGPGAAAPCVELVTVSALADSLRTEIARNGTRNWRVARPLASRAMSSGPSTPGALPFSAPGRAPLAFCTGGAGAGDPS